jgi:hypothetical protein
MKDPFVIGVISSCVGLSIEVTSSKLPTGLCSWEQENLDWTAQQDEHGKRDLQRLFLYGRRDAATSSTSLAPFNR